MHLPRMASSAVFLFFCALGCYAQDSNLVVKEMKTIPAVGALVTIGSPRCTPDGAVIIRPFERSGSSELVRISKDGSNVTRYRLPANLNQNTRLADFSLGNDGHLYVLLTSREGLSIAEFDAGGTFKRKTALDIKGLLPAQFAVTATGGFVVSGHKNNRAAMYFLGDSGEVLNEVVALRADIQAPSQDSATATTQDSYTKAIELSTLASGIDGNVYLARHRQTGPVIVLTPTGELVRTIRLRPPSRRSELVDVRPSPRGLVAVFSESDTKGNDRPKLQILNATTGELVRTYGSDDERIGIGLACVSADSFTFMTADEHGTAQLITAAER